MSNNLDFSVEEVTTRIVTITIKRRLDLFKAQEFRSLFQSLFDQGISHIVIDLNQTTFLDSAGMAVLVSVLKQCRQRNGNVRLVAPQVEGVKRMLELTKFDRVFEIKATAQEAVASFYG